MNKLQEVYVVLDSGCIHGVFTKLDAAENFVNSNESKSKNHFRILKSKVDVFQYIKEKNYIFYEIDFCSETFNFLRMIAYMSKAHNANFTFSDYEVFEGDNYIHVNVWAESPESAIHVARAALDKYLSKKSVENPVDQSC